MYKHIAKKFTYLVGVLVLLSQFIGIGVANANGTISVGSCAELRLVGSDSSHPLDGSYVLTGNFSCAGGGDLVPIGTAETPFTGTLDGQGFSITGLHINEESDDVGLFGYAVTATVKNLNLVGGTVEGYSTVGSIVGGEQDIIIRNVTSSVAVSGDNNVGGIIGSNEDSINEPGLIIDTRFSGSVTGEEYATGGLVGDTDGDMNIVESSNTGTITNTGGADDSGYLGGLIGDSDGILTISKSYSTGKIDGSAYTDSVGGIIGWSTNTTTVTDSYATGDVDGLQNIGGLIGYTAGSVLNSYATGSVSGTNESFGGLIGSVSGIVAGGSFFDNQTTGQTDGCGAGDGCDGITGESTELMKTKSTFTDAEWNFDAAWGISSDRNNGYPYLLWTNANEFDTTLTGHKVALSVPGDCSVDKMSVTAESVNSAQDANYSYPNGMMNYTIDCGTNGYAAEVTQYFYGVSSQTFSLRKYDPNTNTYAAIPGAVITFETVDGQNVAKATYTVTDGSSLDADSTANGIIVDPAGLALSTTTPAVVPGLPDTGLGGL